MSATIAATTEATARIAGPESALDGLRVVVAGLGVSGFPCAVHLAERGADVLVVDGQERADQEERVQLLDVLGARVARGPEAVERLPEGEIDLLVVSQGWRPDSPLIADAAQRGIPIWGEVELAWRVREPEAAPWLTITGTNGKTTVTGMTAAMVSAAGLRTRACGNIGSSLLEAVLDPTLEILCVELASFALHWQRSMEPYASVCLNLDADHLDWHAGMAGYAQDKARIYQGTQKACVYSSVDPATRTMVEQASVAPGARAIGVTDGVPGVGELGVIEDLLVDRGYPVNRHRAAEELGSLDDVAAALGLEGTPPAHQVRNALAAAALVRALGAPAAAVRDGLRAYRPEPHRLQSIATIDGVRWIDDSKATNPHAADASLAGFGRIIWIAGGLAKGAEFQELVGRHADRLRGAVLLGLDTAPFEAALAASAPEVPVRIAAREAPMADAVARAAELAVPGDVVLLAPAAASMDQFADYSARGRAFAEALAAFRDG